jgi:hypothetical protein
MHLNLHLARKCQSLKPKHLISVSTFASVSTNNIHTFIESGKDVVNERVHELITWLVVNRNVTTLTLGSRPRQGLARVWAMREPQESYFMLSKCEKVWGNEPSHSQVNSPLGSWNPKWTTKFLMSNFKGQNSINWSVLSIIRRPLEIACLKWARMTHLNIWNTSYDQKNSWESNWQYDSWTLKVGNCPDFLAHKWRAMYFWKALDEGYNFAWNLIVIGGLHTKL